MGKKEILNSMKIVILYLFLYYYYFFLWDIFFKELGFEVVDIGLIIKDIFDKGLKAVVVDICVFIKIFIGYVIEGFEKVDYVFVLRFVRIKKLEYFCLKFMGFLDIIEGMVEESKGRVILFIINEKNNENISLLKVYEIIIEMFGFFYREI